MSLPAGTILEKRYRVETMLSQGGMGTIYRAYDLKLDIPVAIKENFFQTPESTQQFEREARILARLHHPNLPRVIDHFSFDGKQYLVMDFVEGDDLWELFKQQQSPLDEGQAVGYMIQICRAVSYLHQQEPPIIHRDIKPQNIKITPDGRAVLVDFGIAKMADTDQRTQTGAQAITPGFSPPEQYGRAGTSPVSDIYSLGATLYAILTGQNPPDSISLMAGGAKFNPPDVLNAKLSRQVSKTIEHAMQVRREDRPQSVISWQQELEALTSTSTTIPVDEMEEVTTLLSSTSPPAPQPPALTVRSTAEAAARPGAGNPPWLWIGLAAMALVVAISALAFRLGRGDGGQPAVDTKTILVALMATATAQAETGIVEAPEVDLAATLVALAATATAQTQAVAAQPSEEPAATAEPTATPIPPTDTPATEPTATPVPPTPTPLPTFTPTAAVLGPALTPTIAAGARVAFVSNRDGNNEVYVMNVDGSRPINLTNNPVENDETPAWSPDGRQLIFTSSPAAERRTPENTSVKVMNGDGSGSRVITTQADQPAWSPDGRQLALTDLNSRIVIINIDGSEITQLTPGNGLRADWAADGNRIVFDDNVDLFLINQDGTGLAQLTGPPADETEPAWSPDGRQIAFVSSGDGQADIYLINSDGSNPIRLTLDPADDRSPVWSPDGFQLAFASERDGNCEIYVMNADGSDQINLTQNPADERQPAWSP